MDSSWDACAGKIAEALEGGRGFGSALQVVLRYLGGAASMPQLTEQAGSQATASVGGRATANGVQGVSGMTYAGAALNIAAVLRGKAPSVETMTHPGCVASPRSLPSEARV